MRAVIYRPSGQVLLHSVREALHVRRCEVVEAAEGADVPELARRVGPDLLVLQAPPRMAATDTTVLITGETGTGKELAAELIHQQSRRRDKPFASINCAAIPEGLFESELFGYERGAFTGAQTAREGKLQYADGGTLFL